MVELVTLETCATCAHSKKEIRGNQAVLFCRRYPPQLGFFPNAQGHLQAIAQFPMVQPDERCGEWRRGLVTADPAEIKRLGN